MGSQLTLIDTCNLTLPLEHVVLIFDRDNMLNTSLRLRGKNALDYTVNTTDNETTFYAGRCLLATITRRLFLRDQITFPGLKPTALGSWLKGRPMATSSFVFHAGGRRFEWRETVSGQLVLSESTHSKYILACFLRSRRREEDHVMDPAQLAIKPEVIGMKDVIVLSCVLVEHRLRMASEIQAGPVGMVMYL